MPDEQSLIVPPQFGPMNAPMRMEPSKERLAAPSSQVTVKNTSEAQTHIVVDRYNVGHELRPGEKRNMEMLNDEIEAFRELRRPDRFYPANDPTKPGRLKPPHPLVIEGISENPEPAEFEQRRKRA